MERLLLALLGACLLLFGQAKLRLDLLGESNRLVGFLLSDPGGVDGLLFAQLGPFFLKIGGTLFIDGGVALGAKLFGEVECAG